MFDFITTVTVITRQAITAVVGMVGPIQVDSTKVEDIIQVDTGLKEEDINQEGIDLGEEDIGQEVDINLVDIILGVGIDLENIAMVDINLVGTTKVGIIEEADHSIKDSKAIIKD